MKSVRFFGRHLVLDGDMWPHGWLSCRENSPPMACRAAARSPSASGDRIRIATPEPSRTGASHRMGNRAAREVEAVQAPRLRRRESVEEGEVGRQQIAFDGKMLAAEAVEPGEAFGIQFAREDVAWG
jgi:hypothetical protein